MTEIEVKMMAFELLNRIENDLDDEITRWCYSEGYRDGITDFMEELVAKIKRRENENAVS